MDTNRQLSDGIALVSHPDVPALPTVAVLLPALLAGLWLLAS